MKKLKFVSGQGFENFYENGLFEVKAKETKKFTKLSEAKKYYNSLNEPKSIWECSGFAELIEYQDY
tara:strand:- start:61 stop:258 length:198 start_codon:yes stop_codon:yes gene_type:complete